MTVTERLLAAADPVWQRYYTHPFVLGIQNGDLDRDKFRHYVIQDYFYLTEYAKVFAIGLAKSHSAETMDVFAYFIDAIAHVEQALHMGYFAEFDLANEDLSKVPVSLANLSYTSYMLRVAYEGGEVETLVAILACALSYEHIAKHMIAAKPDCTEDPFYGAWITQYDSQLYHDDNQKLVALIDRLAGDWPEEELERLDRIFVACARYELGFWDMGWNRDF